MQLNDTATDYFIHSFLPSTAFHYLTFPSLLSTSQPQNQVQSRLLLDIVVAQGSSILQLLTSKDKSLLVWWDTLLVLNLGLDIIDGVRGLDFQSDRLSSETTLLAISARRGERSYSRLDKDLHTTT
jgi:hypothetical protein